MATRKKAAPAVESEPTAKAGATGGTRSARATTTKKATMTRKSTATSRRKGATAGAAAADLIVREGEEPWTEAELAEVRTTLTDEISMHQAEIDEVQSELEELIRGASAGAGDDQADAGAKTSERYHEITLVNNARDMLRQAEHALERLDAGTYGTCENCGNPIGKGRLQAFPRATLCVTCKTKQERH